jgi:acetyl esterase/lipase
MSSYMKVLFAYFVITAASAVAGTTENTATAPESRLLWPGGAPGAKGDAEGDKPTVAIYLPPKQARTGTAVVICPGGGYGFLAMDHEGHQIAQWLNSLGVAGIILKYRHRNSGAGYGHPAALQDAQRAIRMVRSAAKKWDIDPNRIGILGFSAGGHLASSAGTHFQKRYYDATDSMDSVSCRPDFMVLVYPVISFTKWCAHTGSRRNLLGKDPDKILVESLSNEQQVTAETPPTFLVHANDDKGVPPENSIYFYLALRKAKVSTEMHIYEKGGHGFGLGQDSGAVSSWPVRCADWMRGMGLLEKKTNQAKQK